MSAGGDSTLWTSLFRIEPRSGRTLQVQLRQSIVEVVREGRIPPCTRMPASRDLAERLGIARNTVILAYQQLVDEGVLVAKERSGYFIAATPRQPPFTPLEHEGTHPQPNWTRQITRPPTADRNIAKPKDWLRYPYPFLYGQFDPSLFPIQAWRECTRAALSVMEVRDWARDLIDGDDAELVEQLRRHVLPRRGIWCAADELLVTMGAQQAIFLLSELLVQGDTVVGIEDPGYPDARNIFGRRTRNIAPLPVDDEGIVLSDRAAACDLIFITPASQCPTTVTMSAERRRSLLALAERHGIVVIEDDYEMQAADGDEPQPALKARDRCGHVLYVGSLSKVIAPGLRLGFIVAPEPVVRELRALRRLMLRHPPANNQRAVSLFMSLGHYDAHLRRLREGLRVRSDHMRSALARSLPEFRVRSCGSSSVWIEGPANLDGRVLATEAARRGILIEPGDVFFNADNPPVNRFRLGFASIATDRIAPGLRALRAAVDHVQEPPDREGNWTHRGSQPGSTRSKGRR